MSENIERYVKLLKLGLPIMIGQFGVIVLSFADTMMVGRCGTAELGAAGFVNNLFNLVIVFSTGFSYGLTPVVGSMYGKGDSSGIGRSLKNSLVVNMLTSIVLMAIMAVLFLNIHRLGQPQELLPLIRPYYMVLLPSVAFVMLFNSFRQFSEGITDTLTPMYVMIGGNILNIVLNWLLIYGKMGFPQMGLLGAGVATLMSRIVMFLVFLFIFLFTGSYAAYRDGFKNEKLNWFDIGFLGKLGLPVGFQMGMETASFSLSTVMVGWIGTMALAAHQVMLTLGQLGFMIYYGMAAAVSVRISNYAGTGDYMEVKKTAGSGFRIILAMAVLVSLVMLLLRHRIGYLFSDSQEVAFAVSQIVIPFVIYQFGDGMQCNYSNALRGIADVKMVTVYAFVAYFIISLPSAYIFAFVLDMGLVGIWLSFPLGLTSAGLMFLLRFRKTLKKSL